MATVMKIGQVPFACVKLAEADLKDRAAVYAILCVKDNGEWNLVDVGQSAEVDAKIDAHPRHSEWKMNCPTGKLWVGVYSMPTASYKKEDRISMEHKLRKLYNPPCCQR